jgi:hypothetical protein
MTSLTLALIALLAAPPPVSKPEANAAAKSAQDKKASLHGAALTLTDRITMDELAARASKLSGKTVQVSGTVSAVCRKKGCWMTLAGDKPGSSARITFKGYGFFVPLDSAGAKAVVEGVVEVKTLDEAERKHLADDAGKSIDTIAKHELRLMANGCELRR